MLSNVKGTNEFAAARPSTSAASSPRTDHARVKLTTPLADFPSLVANPNLAPVPRGLLTTAKKIGQFRNARRRRAVHARQAVERHSTISLVANPDYWGTKPNVAGITFKVIAKPATAYAQFQAGTLDIANFPAARWRLPKLPTAQVPTASRQSHPASHRGAKRHARLLVFNTTKARSTTCCAARLLAGPRPDEAQRRARHRQLDDGRASHRHALSGCAGIRRRSMAVRDARPHAGGSASGQAGFPGGVACPRSAACTRPMSLAWSPSSRRTWRPSA